MTSPLAPPSPRSTSSVGSLEKFLYYLHGPRPSPATTFRPEGSFSGAPARSTPSVICSGDLFYCHDNSAPAAPPTAHQMPAKAEEECCRRLATRCADRSDLRECVSHCLALCEHPRRDELERAAK
jgi:hypothetical protein